MSESCQPINDIKCTFDLQCYNNTNLSNKCWGGKRAEKGNLIVHIIFSTVRLSLLAKYAPVPRSIKIICKETHALNTGTHSTHVRTRKQRTALKSRKISVSFPCNASLCLCVCVCASLLAHKTSYRRHTLADMFAPRSSACKLQCSACARTPAWHINIPKNNIILWARVRMLHKYGMSATTTTTTAAAVVPECECYARNCE